MSPSFTTVSLLFFFMAIAISDESVEFIFDARTPLTYRYGGGHVMLDGGTAFDRYGFAKLTDSTIPFKYGRIFYSTALPFKSSSISNRTVSFSTTFVFAIFPFDDSNPSGNGLAFVISPTISPPATVSDQYLGLFNNSNYGNASNQIVAVEFDTYQNLETVDINDNHVGIDVNSLTSLDAVEPYYYKNGGKRQVIDLKGGEPIQVWVDYDGVEKQLNVSIAPANWPKPMNPLLSRMIDLSPIISDYMYVGFSASTGLSSSSHYVCAWSFKMEGGAPVLDLPDLSLLPAPPSRKKPEKKSKVLVIWLPIISIVFALGVLWGVVVKVRSLKSVDHVLEDWEKEYGPHRFSYKDLFTATKGFAETEVLGSGAFGKVYRGVLPTSKIEIAVKKISHESRQGMREFIAEIVSLGQLRHRNLVQLHGYCRRQQELLIVYEYVPNGNLDKHLFNKNSSLNWKQRIGIVHGVASGLLYLHEDWEQVVLHRDIKPSNILLDSNYNARLGDFGLARLYSHGSDPRTSLVVGTFGYIAPELARTGKATTSTDVFAFGTFLLEVATGKRPVEYTQESHEEVVLADWVLQWWRKGEILYARDPILRRDFASEEVEMVLKLGLLCSHPVAAARPSMRQIMQFLEGDASLPQLSDYDLHMEGLKHFNRKDGFSNSLLNWSSIEDSVLGGGR